MTAPVAPANPCESALGAWCQRYGVDLPDTQATGGCHPLQPVAVAYSAGADSTALLLAAHARWPGRVLALHVHHGLQAAADLFESHARAFCDRQGIAFTACRVNALPASGQSPEDAARISRYTALADAARQANACCVLLGQHTDDQAETLLLALSRGAGLPGLSAMPERFERHGVLFGRPLLGVPAKPLRAWLRASGHTFVDDPSNTDLRYTRNRIRAILLPAWDACFPGYRQTLARSARHAAQAQVLLDDLARIDLAAAGMPPLLAALQRLSGERRSNALRYWLRQTSGVAASAAQLDELVAQIGRCRTRGHRISLKVASGFVTRDGDRLHFGPDLPKPQTPRRYN